MRGSARAPDAFDPEYTRLQPEDTRETARRDNAAFERHFRSSVVVVAGARFEAYVEVRLG